MKRLNVTFEVENDLAEHRLRSELEAMGAKHIKTTKTNKDERQDK